VLLLHGNEYVEGMGWSLLALRSAYCFDIALIVSLSYGETVIKECLGCLQTDQRG